MQQEPGTKQGAFPRGGRLVAAAGLASTGALLLMCILNGPNGAADTRNLRNERQLGFGQGAGGPIDRVSKVLSHALKPRLGAHKGKDVGGPWVHKALDSDDPLERPTLLSGSDSMAGEEEPAPAEVTPIAPTTAPTPKRADSVLHLGGAPREPITGLRHAPPQHRNLQGVPTFGVKKVVPVGEVKGSGDKDGDKGMLKKHGTGPKHSHAHPHKQANLHKHKKGLKKVDGHAHGHKKAGHAHGHSAFKQPVKHMAAQAHKTKKAAVHAMEKAVLKGKVQKAKIQKHVATQAAHARAKAKKAAVQAIKTTHHVKHAHGVNAKPLGHDHDHKHAAAATHGHKKKALHKHAQTVHKAAKKVHHAANTVHKASNAVHKTVDAHAHAHKAKGEHLHGRALQQQLAQAAVAERLNLSPDDVAALRAIARDAALDVIKDAARDAGYDLDFELPSGDDASKEATAEEAVGGGGLFLSTLEDGEEGDMALFEPLDLGLEQVLDALGPAPVFGDRQQVVLNTSEPVTVTNMTGAAKADGEEDDDTGFLLSALRQMNLTAIEADRLRTRARSAAESALRDAAGEAGYSGANLDALITSFAAARGDAPPPATHRQLWAHNGIGGHDAWLADRAQQHDAHHGGHGYYGTDDDAEAAEAWGFYDYADEAVPRSGYSDYRDGTLGSRGGYGGGRRLHWHHHGEEEAEDEDVGPWDTWAEGAEQAGYFVDDEAVEDFFD